MHLSLKVLWLGEIRSQPPLSKTRSTSCAKVVEQHTLLQEVPCATRVPHIGGTHLTTKRKKGNTNERRPNRCIAKCMIMGPMYEIATTRQTERGAAVQKNTEHHMYHISQLLFCLLVKANSMAIEILQLHPPVVDDREDTRLRLRDSVKAHFRSLPQHPKIKILNICAKQAGSCKVGHEK